EVKAMAPKAIILSGGPYYIHDQYEYRADKAILDLGIPVLGICYGMQLLAEQHGGEVEHQNERTYETSEIHVENESGLFANLNANQEVFYSLGDKIAAIPEGFTVDAKHANGDIAAFSHEADKLYGVQFYPEVQETKNGKDILKH